MAKVVRVHRLGGPEVLAVEDLAIPAPGPGEVRIKVAAIGLNRFETMYREGDYGAPSLPAKIGAEAAGAIEAIGPGVTGFAVGDRVACIPGLSMEQYGTNGALILYRADMLVKTAPNQSDTEAAASWMQYLTAWAVRFYRPLQSGDHVVITAASSSVGLAAIELVRADGAIPIAVTRGKGKVEALKRHGATHVVVSDEQDVTQAIRDITGGKGARLVFDAVAGPGFVGLINALAVNGLAIIYGALGGEPTHLPARMMTAFNATIRGYAVNHLIAIPEKRAEAEADILDGIASGRLKPVIDRTFDLAEIAEAHRYLEGSTQIGKIVVTV
jgi:NADPH:quinone reductase-like Zn-dependent oxidoreductase